MGIFKNLLGKSAQPFDLVAAVENHDTKSIIRHLENKSESKNPVAIAYTAEAIMDDLDTLYHFQKSFRPTRDEFAAAVAIRMLHLTHRSTIKWLEQHEFLPPTSDRIIFIGTYMYSIKTLKEFSSANIKKYKISSCGDQRVCDVCQKKEGKVYMVSKAVIGKTAPPFCNKCRCIIHPIFKH